MSTTIEMPKLSDTMTEGTVVRWLKKPGDSIEIGDEIAEIETDKATMAMEAFDEGTLAKILVEEGGKAEIGTALAILAAEGETVNGDSAPSAPTKVPAAAEPAESPAGAEVTAAPEPAPASVPTPTSPAPPTPPATPAPAGEGDRIKASPLARKIAVEKGIDLSTLTGSGPAGRIVKKDVEAAGRAPVVTPPATPASPAPAVPKAPAASPIPAPASEPPAPSAPAPATPTPAPAPVPAPVSPVVSGEDRRIELSTLRRVIAERLLASKTTIPHFYLHVDADAGPLMEIRRQVNAQAEATHGNKYTVNDFILKAVINALQAVPAANASFNGDHIVQYGHIGIAVAVAVDDGLVTPVVKDAAAKSLLQISREVKDLAARAREGKLRPDEFDGGTLTVSNLGAYGIEFFDAIINPPQAAILAVGAIMEKPVAVNGELQVGLRMNLGLSADHRVVDGAVGAQFIAEVKKLLENPALMLV